MKIIASICLLSLVITGCSHDSVLNEPATETAKGTSYAKKSLDGPANPANNKDYTGLIYERILDAYYALPESSRSLQQIITTGEQLAFADKGFMGLSGVPSYQPISASELEAYTTLYGPNIESYLSQSYGLAARETYSELTEELGMLKASKATYDEVYAFLISLEGEVVDNTAIPDDQASAILTTSSILRYGLYHDKKRKRRDRDWDWMTGNIAATANAALESEAEAITVSFATDVYQD
ncbi:hypothetical protein VF13_38160 [Nostoc linckia z16]|nr:hypothetical protein VF12_37665 [Nostoc linckia z15]PHK33954.1 hypothetical protein VF13_38160 [Nostoc linckia z16]